MSESTAHFVSLREHSGYCEICSTRYPHDKITSNFRQHPARPSQYFIHCHDCRETTEKLDKIQTESESAKQELARRELIRRRLINFIIRFNPGYNAGWAHKLVCAKLERFVQDIEQKLSPRIRVSTPPRLGKSTIVSKGFPAWLLGKHPEWEFISAAYAVSLPLGFSRWIKTILSTKEYQKLFPDTKLNPNAQATDEWYTTKGGMFLPVGSAGSSAGGGATGKGAHALSWDDPIKDAQEAQSPQVLKNAWEWWDTVADTRIAPGGGVLLTMTRWNDLDPAGRLEKQEKELIKEITEQMDAVQLILDDRTITPDQHDYNADRLIELKQDLDEIIHWDTIVFPALATHDEYITPDGFLTDQPPPPSPDNPNPTPVRRKDEALHPFRYDAAYYRSKRRRMAKKFWSAMYQQNPVPDEGDKFKRADFRFEPVPYAHDTLPVLSAWDLAVGKGHTHDWTVGMFGVVDYEGRLHIIDRIRTRTDRLAELIVESCIPYRRTLSSIGIENGHIQLSIMPGIEDILNGNSQSELSKQVENLDPPLYLNFDTELKPVVDPDVRIVPAQSWSQHGKIVFPSNQTWVEEVISELVRYPNGTFDDQVTTLAWLVRMAVKAGVPRRPVEKTKQKSWRDKLKAHAAHAPSRRGRRRGYMAA